MNNSLARGVLAAAAVAGLTPTSSAQLNCNPGVEHYPGGGLKQCTLNGDHTFYTARGLRVTCSNGKSLVQHPNGSVQSCSIDEIQDIGEIRCKAPARVEFDADGSLRACRQD